MKALAQLQLIFVTLTDKSGNNVGTHVGFYDLFGGIPEVLPADNGSPELLISPINKYIACPHEILSLWIEPEQKEKIGKYIREIFDKRDPLAMIFSGKMITDDAADLTPTGFCVEALRAAISILPNVPVNCITTLKLYTVLKMMGGM